MHWQKDEFVITDNPDDLDIEVIHRFLRESYWARGIPRAVVERSMANSLCFGLYLHGRQIGFSRAITDRATFAYLADVFVLPDFRRRGLAAWLVTCIVGHPDLQGLRRIMLATADAHGLYRGCGFSSLKAPENFMEIGRVNPFGDGVPG
nr:n-acetyltransferase gcn5 [uncultured bacterium]